MTQEKFVKIWLEENGEITPLDAYKEFAIMRLSSIILRLRKQEIDIRTDYTTSKNRFGVLVTYATYKLKRRYRVEFEYRSGFKYDETRIATYIDAYDVKELKEEFSKRYKDAILLDYWVV